MVNERFVDTFRARFVFAVESARLLEKVLIGWPSALLDGSFNTFNITELLIRSAAVFSQSAELNAIIFPFFGHIISVLLLLHRFGEKFYRFVFFTFVR